MERQPHHHAVRQRPSCQKYSGRKFGTPLFSLLQIIKDILDFSNIEAGKLEQEALPVSIHDLVQGDVDTLTPNAAKKELIVFPHIDPVNSEWEMGDQVRLR